MAATAKFGHPGQPLYLDGQRWLLERGEDFNALSNPKQVVKRIKGEAAVYGLRLSYTIRSDGNIIVQAL